MPPASASANSNSSTGEDHAESAQGDAGSHTSRSSQHSQSAGGSQGQYLLPQAQQPPRLQRTHSASNQRSASATSIATTHPLAYTFAHSAAAAATSGKTRPKLNVSTSYNGTPDQQSLPSPPSAATAVPQASSGRRRLWLRRKSGAPATSLLVEPSELVDDVKSRILMKYPTSLLQSCDPADLVIALSPNSAARVELQPDENVWSVLDRHFPSGMLMSDALELSLTTQSTQSTQNAPSRMALQRARSYSHSHHQQYGSMSPSITGGVPPLPQARHGSEPQTPASSSPHAASPAPVVGSAHSSTGTHSPAAEAPHDFRPKTSVLLMPRQLGGPSGPLSINAERELDGHATTLVPLTGEPSSTSGGAPAWSDAASQKPSVGAATGVQLQSVSAAGLASLQAGKASVVPQINVLIVEDNKINQLILERFLQRKNVRCSVATNGREALEKWRAGGFHLILMDIQLPEMSGLEVTKEIRRLEIVNGIGAFPQAFRGPEISAAPASTDVLPKSEGGFRSPVIIVALTASSEMHDKSEALAAGCNDFLTKPVNLTWLEQKITEWGCMQALIDYAGWKQWSADLPSRSLSRVELKTPDAAESTHVQQQQQQSSVSAST